MPWYLKGLRKDTNHCFVIEHQLLGGYDHLIRIESLTNLVVITTYFATLKEVIELIGYREYKMIEIDVNVDPLIPHNPLSFMNCVGLTKKLLGINRIGIITPFQLYKYLLTKGKKHE